MIRFAFKVKLKSPAEMGLIVQWNYAKIWYSIRLWWSLPLRFLLVKKNINVIFRKNYWGNSRCIRKTCFENGFANKGSTLNVKRQLLTFVQLKFYSVMASMYAVYLGKAGLEYIADQIHLKPMLKRCAFGFRI